MPVIARVVPVSSDGYALEQAYFGTDAEVFRAELPGHDVCQLVLQYGVRKTVIDEMYLSVNRVGDSRLSRADIFFSAFYVRVYV